MQRYANSNIQGQKKGQSSLSTDLANSACAKSPSSESQLQLSSPPSRERTTPLRNVGQQNETRRLAASDRQTSERDVSQVQRHLKAFCEAETGGLTRGYWHPKAPMLHRKQLPQLGRSAPGTRQSPGGAGCKANDFTLSKVRRSYPVRSGWLRSKEATQATAPSTKHEVACSQQQGPGESRRTQPDPGLLMPEMRTGQKRT